MGEHGVSLENMDNMENMESMEKVENMEKFTGSPTEMTQKSPEDFWRRKASWRHIILKPCLVTGNFDTSTILHQDNLAPQFIDIYWNFPSQQYYSN